MTARVALCTLDPIDRTAPRGFAARWSCVANALAGTFSTTVIDVLAPGTPELAHEAPVAQGMADHRSVALGRSLSERSRDRLGQVGRGASIGLDALTGRPPWIFGAARGAAAERLQRAVGGFDLVVLPYHLAHLASVVGPVAPTVVFLDEGPERRIFAYRTAMRPTSALHAGLRRHAAEALYRQVGECASIVVAISEVERFHFGTFVQPEKIVVVPDTTDPALGELRQSPPPAAGRLGLLVCGRFDMQHKTYAGLGELIRTADERLRAAGITPSWTLAGKGGASVDTDGVECARWEGDDLREVYGPADVALVPGQTVIGVRSTLLQAFATATPAITLWDAAWTLGATPGVEVFAARGTPELPEVIVDAATGGRLADVGAAGRRFVETHNSWDAVGAAAVAACRSAIERSGRC